MIEEQPGSSVRSILFRIVTWFLAGGCFYLVYTRIEAAAQREGLSAIEYLVNFFQEANWLL